MMGKKTWMFVLVLLFQLQIVQAQTAVDFKLTDLNGSERSLFTELDKGNTVILDFFFVDCKPCQKLTPGMVNLYNEYVSQSKSITIFGISDRDNNARLLIFEDDYKVTYSSCGIEGGGDTITDLYKGLFNFQGWPTYAVICPNREVYWNLERDSSFVKVRAAIDSCAQRVGIDLNREDVGCKIYPNPAQDFISVDAPNLVNFGVKVFSLEGRELMYKEGQTSESKIDIAALEPGIYIVQVKGENKIFNSKIIIK